MVGAQVHDYHQGNFQPPPVDDRAVLPGRGRRAIAVLRQSLCLEGSPDRKRIPDSRAGLRPAQQVLMLPEVNRAASQVADSRHGCSSTGCRRAITAIPRPGTIGEYAGKRMEVVGMFSLGTDFANDANLFMSDTQYVEAVYPPARQQQAWNKSTWGYPACAGADPKPCWRNCGACCRSTSR